jgi:hypothetical protein
MTDFATRMEQAEMRLDQAQIALDRIGRVLNTAERAQAASERARSSLRITNGLLVGAAIVAGALLVVLRRRS